LSLDETTEEILDEDEVLGVSMLYKCNNINNNVNNNINILYTIQTIYCT